MNSYLIKKNENDKCIMNLLVTIEIQKVTADAKTSLRKMQSMSRKNLYESLFRRLCIKKNKIERKSLYFIQFISTFIK